MLGILVFIFFVCVCVTSCLLNDISTPLILVLLCQPTAKQIAKPPAHLPAPQQEGVVSAHPAQVAAAQRLAQQRNSNSAGRDRDRDRAHSQSHGAAAAAAANGGAGLVDKADGRHSQQHSHRDKHAQHGQNSHRGDKHEHEKPSEHVIELVDLERKGKDENGIPTFKLPETGSQPLRFSAALFWFLVMD